MSSKDYLKKYMSIDPLKEERKKKKKAKVKVGSAVRVMDEDVNWFDDKKNEENPDEAPVVVDLGEDADSGDASPPRKRKRAKAKDASPPRRRRNDSDDDASPPRKGARHDSDGDASPPRRAGAGDASPPRRPKGGDDRDASPPRKGRHDSDNDASPPRKRHDSDNDASPPRKGRHNSDNDASPPRRGRHDSDGDASPPRRGDASKKDDKADDSRKRKRSPEKDSGRDTKRAKPDDDQATRMTGLVKGKDFKLQAEAAAKKEEERLKALAPEKSGRFAETVIRDKHGRKLTMLNEMINSEGKKKEEEIEWGTGRVQKQQKEDEKARREYEASKPFARYADDVDLERDRKREMRWDDPMRNLVSAKEELKNLRPQYRGPPPPPNRFGIMPDYKWDGRDRSNGFEKKMFSAQSDKKALEDEKYKWSVEDM